MPMMMRMSTSHATSTRPTMSKKHSENVIRVHMVASREPMPLFYLFNVCSSIVSMSLLLIREDRVCFSHIFEDLICFFFHFFSGTILIWVPFQGHFLICLFNFIFSSSFLNS
mmetsp:Transcript_2838/g.2660  ORF Transcript_2838/g.2660 Transcript_2838/m.2660 type:complete len:112 (-) Transcript_2838:1144-1479(-)